MRMGGDTGNVVDFPLLCFYRNLKEPEGISFVQLISKWACLRRFLWYSVLYRLIIYIYIVSGC